MELILKTLLWGLLFPAVAAGSLLVLLWRPWNREGAGDAAMPWPGGLAIGAAFLLAFRAIYGGFLPPWGAGALVYVALLGALVGAARSGLAQRPGPRRVAGALAIALVLAFVLRPLQAHQWGRLEGLLWFAGLWLAAAAFWQGLDRLESELPPGAILAALVATAGASGAALLVAGTALLAQLAGALAAAAVGAWAAARWGGSAGPLVRSALPVFALLLPTLWTSGYFYAELSGPRACLLALAPAGLGLALLPALRERGPLARGLAAAAGVALPLAAALAL